MNDGKKVVEIMGDASGELTHHFHLLCLTQLLLKPLAFGDVIYLFLKLLAFGDVLFNRNKMADFSIDLPKRRDGHFLVVEGSIFAPVD